MTRSYASQAIYSSTACIQSPGGEWEAALMLGSGTTRLWPVLGDFTADHFK